MANDNYAIYLRKSRKDLDAELHGEGETLARHEHILLDLAHKQKLNVVKIYREIVSGESIAARPQMKELLYDVMQNKYVGVLCVEVERLARGDTMDQGEVAKAFKFGNCKIVTPAKTYDPNNEYDEEYFEFGLFMSRREYKTITRRIQRGRIASVQEGKWIASTAPYGYSRIKIENAKGWTLQINPEESNIVQLIYELYTKGQLQEDGNYKRLGQYRIAKYLDDSGVKPRSGNHWSESTIKDCLTNPAYIGKVRWGWRPVKKQYADGEFYTTRTKLPPDQYSLIDGLHEPIIDEFTWKKAQDIRKSHSIHPVSSNKNLYNPLSGLIYCGLCGSKLTRIVGDKKHSYHSLKCPNKHCNNVSSSIYIIESEVISGLHKWIEQYKISLLEQEKKTAVEIKPAEIISIEAVRKEMNRIEKQLNNTYDLLEQGIYDKDTFLNRNSKLSAEKAELQNNLIILEERLQRKKELEEKKNIFIPRFEHILNAYYNVGTTSEKNEMLKEIVEKIIYIKEKQNKKGERNNANFILDIHPVLPDSEKPL